MPNAATTARAAHRRSDRAGAEVPSGRDKGQVGNRVEGPAEGGEKRHVGSLEEREQHKDRHKHATQGRDPCAASQGEGKEDDRKFQRQGQQRGRIDHAGIVRRDQHDPQDERGQEYSG